MKFFTAKFFLIILSSNYFTISASFNVKKQVKQCKNPDKKILNEKMGKIYNENIEKIIEGIEYFSPTQNKYQYGIPLEYVNINKNHNFLTEGSTVCARTKITSWNGHSYKSTCPHHFVNVTRDDLYPFSRKHAVCNCENCLNLEQIGKMGCKPIYAKLYALKRGVCRGDGEYEWKPVLEQVAISCSCSQFTTYSQSSNL